MFKLKSFFVVILSALFSLSSLALLMDEAKVALNSDKLTVNLSKASKAKRKKAPIKERKLYVGSDSTEAVLEYNGVVQIEAERKPGLQQAQEHIENQVVHMFGPMSFAESKAVPKGNNVITNVKVTTLSSQVHKITYHYKGTIVLQNGPEKKYEFVLPVDPSKIYQLGMVAGKNPCTDSHYQSEGDFWYFWNPEQPGCQLHKKKAVLTVSGSVVRKKNTEESYPEYERLADKDNVIKMTLLMGMDEATAGRDPNDSDDINASNFRDIKKSLISKNGFKGRLWSKEEIKKIVPSRLSKPVYVEEFTKTVKPKEGKEITLSLRVFFGPSGIDEDSAAFHYFYKDSLENQALMMYDGHSGLGGHLDLSALEEKIGKITLNKNIYQMLYFNSCTSYTYYNTMYFDRKKTESDKKGTKNLDILTNGLATYFSVMHDTNLAIINAIEAYAEDHSVRTSYQALAREIDSDNLFGINGDEDNPKN